VNKNTLTGHTYRDSENVYYTTALHIAAKNGHVATVKLLIENGADLNTRHESSFGHTGSTPLSVAAERGNSLCAIELIKAGADVNLAGSSGATPLMIAASEGREAIVALLIGFGADVSLCNCRGEAASDFLDEAFEEFDGGVDRNIHAACIPIQESLHGVAALLMGTDHARRYNPTKCTWTYPEQCHHV
jgi:ankyrin repeat protein